MAYARVFGDQDDALHACPGCTNQAALANGAGAAPDADGTRRVHRPDADGPVPAVVREAPSDGQEEASPVLLKSVNDWAPSSGARAPGDGTSGEQQFRQLVAEDTAP
nr:hypothetical protein [Haloglomus sp. DT116]